MKARLTSSGGAAPVVAPVHLAPLHAKFGQMALEKNFFSTRVRHCGIAARKAMIDRDHDLPITRQAKLLGISRRAVYYLPRPTSPADLGLMHRIDELHLKHPFVGARMLRRQLQRQDAHFGRRYIATLWQHMCIDALALQPGISRPAPGHKIIPYLLTVLLARSSSRPSRAGGTPDIVNADQCSHITATESTDVLLGEGCLLSTDGRGAWRDIVFVERLWRSVKYERV